MMGARTRRTEVQGFEDKTLTCRDCQSDFMFTAGEQDYYTEKGLRRVPKRCPACLTARRRIARERMTEVACASCGIAASVPFVPHLDCPVYCNACFERARPP